AALAPLLAILMGLLVLPVRIGHAAGAVEMQVERIVTTAIDEYNQAMESGDPEAWLKYFTDNVRRSSPLSSQQGKAALTEYYQGEFKNFKARWNTKKTIVMGRSAAAVVDCEIAQRPGGAEAKTEMVIVFELASSGRFESVDFYFDTAKVAKVIAAAK
ncbi:MAG TPA: nuclear transport factor 2 family protein, partial [Burkholderiales bacterium]|nr:nuclear transport factor 2 family protein [Burkholderiales bacterium]